MRVDCTVADCLSRHSVRETEWSLNKAAVDRVFYQWGHPLMDLFATFQNKKTQLFCSWMIHQHAFATDAMSVSWQNMFAYAFPPIQMIPSVLQHMKQFQCKIILIAPHWPRQYWFPQLLKMLIAFPVKLTPWKNLLSQVKGQILHPDPQSLKLTAWLLSTDTSLQRDFQKKTRKLLASSWRKGMKKDYNSKFKQLLVC